MQSSQTQAESSQTNLYLPRQSPNLAVSEKIGVSRPGVGLIRGHIHSFLTDVRRSCLSKFGE